RGVHRARPLHAHLDSHRRGLAAPRGARQPGRRLVGIRLAYAGGLICPTATAVTVTSVMVKVEPANAAHARPTSEAPASVMMANVDTGMSPAPVPVVVIGQRTSTMLPSTWVISAVAPTVTRRQEPWIDCPGPSGTALPFAITR